MSGQPNNCRVCTIPEEYFKGLDVENDDWALLKAYSRYMKVKSSKWRHANVEEYDGTLEGILKAHPMVLGYQRHTRWHASFRFGNFAHVDYYPSKKKLIYKNMKFEGSLDKIMEKLQAMHCKAYEGNTLGKKREGTLTLGPFPPPGSPDDSGGGGPKRLSNDSKIDGSPF